MRSIIITITICCFLQTALAQQQSKIIFLNGKEIENIEILNSDNVRTVKYKIGKKTKTAAKIDIFSVIKDGDEAIYYQPDDVTNTMPVDSMRMFVKGKYYARKTYHAGIAFLSGLTVGWLGGSGQFTSPMIGSLFVPTWTGLVAITPTTIKKISTIPPEYLKSEYFISGYKTQGSKMKITNALLGGILGYFGGFAYAKTKK